MDGDKVSSDGIKKNPKDVCRGPSKSRNGVEYSDFAVWISTSVHPVGRVEDKGSVRSWPKEINSQVEPEYQAEIPQT